MSVESAPWNTSVSYGLSTVPTLFLVDADGEVLFSSPGLSRDDLLEAANRAAALSGGEPANPFPEDAKIPPFRPG